MQEDGHLVLYNRDVIEQDNSAVWATKVGGNYGHYAILEDDGRFIIYDGDN